jgi:hypothetical protein
MRKKALAYNLCKYLSLRTYYHPVGVSTFPVYGRLLDVIGPVPQSSLDKVRFIFNVIIN